MKRIKQTSIILMMVACAFAIKAMQSKQMILLVLGIFLCVFALLRMQLVNTYMKDLDDENPSGEDSILRYLHKDSILYADALVVYQKGNCDVLYDERDGFLFYDHTSKYYYGSASTLAGAKDIVLKLPMDYGVLIAYDALFEEVAGKELPYSDKLQSYNHVYESRKPYVVETHSFHLKMLDESHKEMVKQQYSIKDLCTDEYILDCIKTGMLGAFDQERLAGFIGMHDTKAIGLLEVKSAYRGQHLATILEQEYINGLLKKELMPIYTQVNAKNEVSLHLQQKLGFTKAKTPMYWYFS